VAATLGNASPSVAERSITAALALGYRSLGDYARERLGVGARTVREWARVSSALAGLPRLRAAFLSGEVGFSVLRRVVGYATPETEEACLASVRGRTLRAVDAMVRAVRAAAAADADASGPVTACPTLPEDESG
jgi:hypothetical protein